MNRENQEKSRFLNGAVWGLALLLVLAIGLMTFFSAASMRTEKKAGEKEKTEAVTDEEDKQEKKPSAAEQVTEALAPATPDSALSAETPETAAVNADAEAVTESDVMTSVFPSGEALVFIMPVNGSVQKEYTEDVAVYSLTMNDYRVHNGIDIAAPVGTNVCAACGGTVEQVWEDPFLGNCIRISHGGGMESLYAGLLPDMPKGMEAGATVLAGDVIGGVGESMAIEMADSPHLHFCITDNGVYVNPLDYISNYAGDYTVVSADE